MHALSAITRTEEEYNVESAEYISEMLVSDVLTTSVGKQSMKVTQKKETSFFFDVKKQIIFFLISLVVEYIFAQ